MPPESVVLSALKALRKKLLDTTRRTRLLNLSMNQKDGLRVIDEMPNQLFETLLQGGSMNFVPVPEPKKNELLATGYLQTDPVTKLDVKTKEHPTAKQWAKEIGLSIEFEMPTDDGDTTEDRHTDNSIQAPLYPHELNLRLKNIYQKSRLAISETGVNILYLCFGFLEWRDGGNQSSNAPLFLLPLEIEKGRLNNQGFYEYRISYSNASILPNLSLKAKLKNDFGLALPKIEEDTKPEEYIRLVKSLIEHNQPDWKIHRYVNLALLNFSRLMMYSDLNPENWTGDDLLNNPIINKLLGSSTAGNTESEPGSGFDFLEEYQLDSFGDANTKYPLVLEADSSQHSAIVDVIDGDNVVIEGPPGTGKSQTIINLIASAIGNGKSVLFVAEKQAALSVVYDKLSALGLDDFCLNLHSNKAAKNQIMESIQKRLSKYKKYRKPESIAKEIEEHERLVLQLNNYSNKVNSEWRSCGYTPHEILSKGARYQNLLTSELLLSIDLEVESLNKHIIESHETELEIYVRHYENVINSLTNASHVSECEWYGVGNHSLMAFEFSDFIESLQEWQNSLEAYKKWEDSLVAEYPFIKTEGSFFIQPCIANELDMLDINVSDINIEDLKTISSENFDYVNTSLESYNTFQLTYKELSENHFSPDTILSSLTCNILPNAFDGVNITLCAREVYQELGKLPGLEEELIYIDELLLQINNTLVGANLDISIDGVKQLIVISKAVNAINTAHIAHRDSQLDGKEAHGLIQDLSSSIANLNSLKNELSATYKISELPDYKELLAIKSIIDDSNILSFVKSSYRSARKELISLSSNKYIKFDTLKKYLGSVIDYQKETEKTNNRADYASAFGSYLNGESTDIELISANVNWFQEINNLFSSKSVNEFNIKTILINSSSESFVQTKEQLNSSVIGRLESFLSKIERLGETFPVLTSKSDTRLLDNRKLSAPSSEELSANLKNIEPFVRKEKEGESLKRVLNRLENMGSFCRDYTSWRESLKCNDFFSVDLPQIASEESQKKLLESNKTVEFAKVIYFDLSALALKEYVLSNISEGAFSGLRKIKEEMVERHANSQELFQRFDTLAMIDIEKWLQVDGNNLDGIIAKNTKAIRAQDNLASWVEFIHQMNSLKEIGLSAFLSHFENNDSYKNILDTYRAIIFNKIGQNLIKSDPDLSKFSVFSHKVLQENFSKCDKALQKLQVEMISYQADQRDMRTGNTSGVVSNYTEGFLLKWEANKKTRHIPLRQLIKRSGNSLKAIKPCFMMSPLSVAHYLPPGEIEFDLVVMDEASQIKPQDALGAIARGRQLVVVGDPKQLPPTSFFDKVIDSDNDVDEQTAIEQSESILDVAMPLFKLRRLNWHYRSRHHSLIAFSNHAFYDDKLIVFTSSNETCDELGLHYSRLPNGLYINRMNAEEAKKVALSVKEHMLSNPNESLGVIAMNIKQEKLIRDEIEYLSRQGDREFSQAYEKNSARDTEPFFVKNLETVQGDERDVIFISMTYGPQSLHGRVNRNFNTSKETFWRRLNVLFTRAKLRMHVFSSMGSEDIPPDGDKGMKALHGFLKYCETGEIIRTRHTGKEPDSDFEIAVMDMLEDYGFECVPQVGEAGFFIDIAVRDPGKPGKFLMAVECDGATYHSSKTARDRDRLRQEILEGLGWNVKRIWSTDWFNNPKSAIKSIVEELNELKTDTPEVELETEEKAIQEIVNFDSQIGLIEYDYMTPSVTIQEKLSRFNEEVIIPKHPSTKPDSRLLRPAMIEALSAQLPLDKTEFLEKIPEYLREKIDWLEAGDFLDAVINIINSSEDSVAA